MTRLTRPMGSSCRTGTASGCAAATYGSGSGELGSGQWALGSVALAVVPTVVSVPRSSGTKTAGRTCHRANVGETRRAGKCQRKVAEVGEKDEDNRVGWQQEGPFPAGQKINKQTIRAGTRDSQAENSPAGIPRDTEGDDVFVREQSPQ